MFRSSEAKKKINRINKQCLGFIYSDYKLVREDLLKKDETVIAHQKELAVFGTNYLYPTAYILQTLR